MSTAKDLHVEPPTSPRVRTGGYVILARTADKCRALLAGTVGEYHYDCPLDNILFGFKGVTGDAFKAEVEKGASNEELAAWLDRAGTPKTAEEIKAWSDGVEAYSMYDDPEKRDFFVAETTKLGLDPTKVTLFDWLEADDKASYAQ